LLFTLLFIAAEFVVVHNGIITNYKDLKEFLVCEQEQSFPWGWCSAVT